MRIVDINDEIRSKLKQSNFTVAFLNNCLNSKFLAIEEDNSKIVGACFVGGLLNTNGIEINEEFRGKGLSKNFLNGILQECKKRKISFLTGLLKPSNIISIKLHLKLGYIPLFTFYYNEIEGREIIVILPLSKKGHICKNLLRIFNLRIGNFFFAIMLEILKPSLKKLTTFSSDTISKSNFLYSIKNFEKVERTLDNYK